MTGRVIVLADDLIWQTRLVATLRALGLTAETLRTMSQIERMASWPDAAIVDLTATAYDPVAAIEALAARGTRILAVGQHDDVPLRKRALSAGADRVFAYRKLFEDGPATIAAWLGIDRTAIVT